MPSSSSASINRHTYMPPSIDRTMSEHLQQSLPPNLRPYVNTEHSVYVPEHIQKALSEHMQKNLPSHLKRYADAYVQQNIVDPSFSRKSTKTSPSSNAHPRLNLQPSHNYSISDTNYQHTSLQDTSQSTQNDIAQSEAQSPQDNQGSNPTLPSGPNGTLDPEYKFIFDNPKKNRWHFKFGLLSGNNFVRNIALVVGVGVVLIILIIIASSLFGPKNVNSKQLIDVMARAQEIARVSTLVSQQQNSLDTNTQNLAATVSTSLTSEQAQLTSYLHSERIKKISTKSLSLYLNKNTDTQLQTAAQNNHESTTYYGYLKTQLASYESSIKTAYNGSGPKAKTILRDASASTQTLLASPQLASAAQ